MKLKLSKLRVEIEIDDLDMNNLMNGQEVVMQELGANDHRSLSIRRWKNPLLRMSADKKREIAALELLTGEQIMPREEQAPSFNTPEVKPFTVRGEADATEEFGQAGPKQETREAFGNKVRGSFETGQWESGDVQGGRKVQGTPDRSEDDGEKADNLKT